MEGASPAAQKRALITAEKGRLSAEACNGRPIDKGKGWYGKG